MTFLLFIMAPSDMGFDSPYGLECLVTQVTWERGFVFMECLIVKLKASLRATLFVANVAIERRLNCIWIIASSFYWFFQTIIFFNVYLIRMLFGNVSFEVSTHCESTLADWTTVIFPL
jgi:hypothetical protein